LQSQIVVIALNTGEIVIRAPYEDGEGSVLARYQSGYDQIVDIVGPHNVNEESFIGVLNADGRLKVINYTIIENMQTY